jgi:hypothetical protein
MAKVFSVAFGFVTVVEDAPLLPAIPVPAIPVPHNNLESVMVVIILDRVSIGVRGRESGQSRG